MLVTVGFTVAMYEMYSGTAVVVVGATVLVGGAVVGGRFASTRAALSFPPPPHAASESEATRTVRSAARTRLKAVERTGRPRPRGADLAWVGLVEDHGRTLRCAEHADVDDAARPTPLYRAADPMPSTTLSGLGRGSNCR